MNSHKTLIRVRDQWINHKLIIINLAIIKVIIIILKILECQQWKEVIIQEQEDKTYIQTPDKIRRLLRVHKEINIIKVEVGWVSTVKMKMNLNIDSWGCSIN